MLNILLDAVRSKPQVLLFLSLIIGYFVGRKVKVFGFTLGPTASVLLVALFLGQIGVQIPNILKDISFAVFIFTVGYKVGPEFFATFKREGLYYLGLTVVFALVTLAITFGIGKVMKFDPGTTVGMFAGSLTTSSALGTGEGAIRRLFISGDAQNSLASNMVVAYAITYVFGTVGTILFMKLMPKLLKIDLKEEAKKLEKQLGDKRAHSKAVSYSKQLNVEKSTSITDFAPIALGCIVGTLIGLIVVNVSGIALTLGAGGGILITGLFFGWLRSKCPRIGCLPKGAQSILSDLGLNMFIACVGLSVGPQAFYAFKAVGISVLVGGAMITLIPTIIILFLGRNVFKMNPILLFGAVVGAHNTTSALNAIIEEADSSLPALGYAAPYAITNFLLTIFGSLIVNIM